VSSTIVFHPVCQKHPFSGLPTQDFPRVCASRKTHGLPVDLFRVSALCDDVEWAMGRLIPPTIPQGGKLQRCHRNPGANAASWTYM
jgi:hypothetical protein